MVTSRALVLCLSLLGVTLAPCIQGRIVSFHAPNPMQPKLVELPIFNPQHLFPMVANEPAPVHEEQDEPPPPDSRARARANATPIMMSQQGFIPNFSPFPQSANPATPSGVVQVTNPIIPNAPRRIVNPPPPEALPVQNIQPLSIDPMTGEPLKQVSPKFRALLSPTAPPVSVPNPINIDNFGRGFGGAPVLDVEGQQINQAPNAASSFGEQSFQSFGLSSGQVSSFGPSTPAPPSLLENAGISSSFQSSTSSFGPSAFSTQSGFQPIQESTGFQTQESTGFQPQQPTGFQPQESTGFQPQESTAFQPQESTGFQSQESTAFQPQQSTGFQSAEATSGFQNTGDESSVSTVTNSQVLPGTSSSFSSTVYH
ncbi:hypothetical protein B566_EDAN001348 [Ephemera danica]|nr:hypothetical protein B566_EDAN001348 [Ephemera danica]